MFRFRRLSFWWLYNVCSPLLEEATFRGQILEEEGLEARFLCWWGQILRGILEESSGIGRDVLERRFPSKYSCGFISDYCWIFIISNDNNLSTESFKYYEPPAWPPGMLKPRSKEACVFLTKFMFWAVETWILVASAWALAVPPAWYACCGICVKVWTHTYVTTTLPHCS